MQSDSEDWTEVWRRLKEGDLNALQLIYDRFIFGLNFQIFIPES